MAKGHILTVLIFLCITGCSLVGAYGGDGSLLHPATPVAPTVCPICGGQIEWIVPFESNGGPNEFKCLNENKVYYGYYINGNGFWGTHPVEPVNLTIYVHDGDVKGALIAGAEVIGNRVLSSNEPLSHIEDTGIDGYVRAVVYPGDWWFRASADGYVYKIWYEGVDSSTPVQNVFLRMKETQQESVATTPSSEPVFGDNQQQQESVPTTTPQGSESSIVGKWAFHIESEQIKGPSDPAHYHDHQTWDDVIDFNNDGTFTGDFAGKWVQSGNTIRLQKNPSPEVDHDDCKIWEAEGDTTYEGTINGDTMSGTGATGWHGSGLCSDRSWPNQWSASRLQ